MWKQGDKIQKGEETIEIIGVCGEVVFTKGEGKMVYCVTQKGLEDLGWKLVKEKWVPDKKEVYFVPNLFCCMEEVSEGFYWYGTENDNYRLAYNLVFKTKEEAIARREEILKLIKPSI